MARDDPYQRAFEAARDVERHEEALKDARQRLTRALLRAAAEGAPVRMLAQLTGLSSSRVQQLLQDARADLEKTASKGDERRKRDRQAARSGSKPRSGGT